MIQITATDVDALSLGCAILGSGGGGDVEAAALLLSRTLSEGAVRLADPDEIDSVAPCALVGAVGSIQRLATMTRKVVTVRSGEETPEARSLDVAAG